MQNGFTTQWHLFYPLTKNSLMISQFLHKIPHTTTYHKVSSSRDLGIAAPRLITRSSFHQTCLPYLSNSFKVLTKWCQISPSHNIHGKLTTIDRCQLLTSLLTLVTHQELWSSTTKLCPHLIQSAHTLIWPKVQPFPKQKKSRTSTFVKES